MLNADHDVYEKAVVKSSSAKRAHTSLFRVKSSQKTVAREILWVTTGFYLEQEGFPTPQRTREACNLKCGLALLIAVGVLD
jgi:hypothetical protein